MRRGQHLSLEARAKISLARKREWADPERRVQRMVGARAGGLKRRVDPEKKKERYRAYQRKWKSEARKNPEFLNTERGRKRAWYAHNPESVLSTQLRGTYGITLEQYNKMWELQGGVCALCKKIPSMQRLTVLRRPDVDHDKETGRVRGLLCSPCNITIVGANSAASARRLLAYLESDFDGRSL